MNILPFLGFIIEQGGWISLVAPSNRELVFERKIVEDYHECDTNMSFITNVLYVNDGSLDHGGVPWAAIFTF